MKNTFVCPNCGGEDFILLNGVTVCRYCRTVKSEDVKKQPEKPVKEQEEFSAPVLDSTPVRNDIPEAPKTVEPENDKLVLIFLDNVSALNEKSKALVDGNAVCWGKRALELGIIDGEQLKTIRNIVSMRNSIAHGLGSDISVTVDIIRETQKIYALMCETENTILKGD